MLTANLLLLILHETASTKQQSRQWCAARWLRLVFPIRCRFGANIVWGVEREWARCALSRVSRAQNDECAYGPKRLIAGRSPLRLATFSLPTHREVVAAAFRISALVPCHGHSLAD